MKSRIRRWKDVGIGKVLGEHLVCFLVYRFLFLIVKLHRLATRGMSRWPMNDDPNSLWSLRLLLLLHFSGSHCCVASLNAQVRRFFSHWNRGQNSWMIRGTHWVRATLGTTRRHTRAGALIRVAVENDITCLDSFDWHGMTIWFLLIEVWYNKHFKIQLLNRKMSLQMQNSLNLTSNLPLTK